MFNIDQFRENILAPALDALQIRSKELAELLVFTCAVESAGGTYVKQIQGPALGIYQIEPNSFTDVWQNYAIRKPDVLNLLALNLGVHRVPEPREVITNLLLATAMCALFYQHRKVFPKQMDEDYLWDLYKKYYNTEKGAAQKEPSILAYRKFIGRGADSKKSK
jgi:hypothetical protein